MNSVSSDAVAKAGSYSTTEHFTGKYWIDGKPIYRKTYVWNGDRADSFTLGNFDTDYYYNIIDMRCFGFGSNSGRCFSIPYADATTSWIISAFIQTNGEIRIQNAGAQALIKVFVYIEYTKPTD